jgi:hypothetical protein
MSEIAALREEVERLGAMLAGRMEDPPGYSACVARFRLSVTEQRLLRRLLQQRAATLAPLAEAPGGVPGAATDEPGAIGDTGERTAAPREGRELLRRLSQQLRQAPYRPFR